MIQQNFWADKINFRIQNHMIFISIQRLLLHNFIKILWERNITEIFKNLLSNMHNNNHREEFKWSLDPTQMMFNFNSLLHQFQPAHQSNAKRKQQPITAQIHGIKITSSPILDWIMTSLCLNPIKRMHFKHMVCQLSMLLLFQEVLNLNWLSWIEGERMKKVYFKILFCI